MDSAPLLTIAVPTYNRARTLGLCIDSLIASMVGCEDGACELLVLDNASSDETPRVLEDATARHGVSRITMVRQSSNLGYDGNHLDAYLRARGRYIWFCSDRYLYATPVALVVRILRRHAPGALTFSSLFRSLRPVAGAAAPENANDSWLAEMLHAEGFSLEGQHYLLTSVRDFISAGALKRGVPTANVSDCIVERDVSRQWLDSLETFRESYMLVVVALLGAFRDDGRQVAVLQLPWFSSAFQRMDSGGARHDNRKVASANLRMAGLFPFLGGRYEVARAQLACLLNVRRKAISGELAADHRVGHSDILDFIEEAGYRLDSIERLRVWLSRLESPLLARAIGTAETYAAAALRAVRSKSGCEASS